MDRKMAFGAFWIFAALFSRSAGACDCVMPLGKWALDSAAAVFTGKVVELNEGGYHALVEVYSTWKGVSPWKKTVEVNIGFSDCAYELELGQEYLLYTDQKDGKLFTHLCYPNHLLAEAGEELSELGRPRWRLWHHRSQPSD
jgi:hypothetical protein